MPNNYFMLEYLIEILRWPPIAGNVATLNVALIH